MKLTKKNNRKIKKSRKIKKGVLNGGGSKLHIEPKGSNNILF